jgi:hypothetical protein
MIRNLLLAAALVGASGAALAHYDGYGRVIAVEPRLSISFGTGYYDGFRVLYESGGQRYWTYAPRHPGHVIVLPPAHRVHPIHDHRRHHDWDGRRGWDDRRGWDGGRGWDDRRGWDDDRRHDRRHDRH